LAVHFERNRDIDFVADGFRWEIPLRNACGHGALEDRVSG
jgi:hypothetical protein